MINPAVSGIRDTHPSWPAARRRSCGFAGFFLIFGVGWVGWDGAITSVALRSHTDGSLAVPRGLVGCHVKGSSLALALVLDATS